MAYFLVVWNVLLFTSLASGFYGLKRFQLPDYISPIQYDIVRLWLGLAIQCLVLLVLGFFIPLNLILLVFVSVIIAEPFILNLIRPRNKFRPSEFLTYFADFLRRVGLPLFLAQIVLATLLLRPIVWFDTGLYHLGAARWLAEHGFVPGLALMNAKFGFVSSWFALTASIVPGFIGDHIGPASNGFLLVISSCSLILVLGEWHKDKKIPLENFFLITYLLGLTSLYLASWAVGESILVSLSHDLPVNYMVGILCWLLLIAAKPKASDVHQPGQTLDIHLIVLILAAIIVSFKLTGLFLLPIALAVYGLKQPSSLKRWGMGLGVSGLTLLPLAIAQIITSGCLLYPSQSFCLAVPWALPATKIAKEADYIVSGGFLPSFSKNLLAIPASIWSAWSEASDYAPKVMLATLLLLLSSLLIVWRVFKCKDRPPGENWIILVGICGSLFIFTVNSYVIFRFGGGIILILPTYFLALFIHRFFLHKKRRQALSRRRMGAPSSSPSHQLRAVMSLVLLGAMIAMIAVNPGGLMEYAFLPPPVPEADLLYANENGIAYTLPEDGYVRCWNAELPCAPNPLNEIHFRDPQQGLGGGFIHIEEPE
mgnify:CR=1 FL=1